jgi:hypothetical protein
MIAEVAERLAARAPRGKDRLERFAWRARNRDRIRAYSPTEATFDRGLLDEFRERGIAIRAFDEVFSDHTALDRLVAAAQSPPVEVESGSKDFLTRLMPARVSLDGPYLSPALEPQVIALANAYMEMRSYLRAVDVWLNVPTDDAPKLSQLWHRDYDDRINVKIFVYLTDVTERHGPFTFAPRTHPRGNRRLEVAKRLEDNEMAELVPRDEWVVCTGPVGTVVIADTCGYHKGGKPDIENRMLWTAQYTSGAPRDARSFELEPGALSSSQLTPEQRAAILDSATSAA